MGTEGKEVSLMNMLECYIIEIHSEKDVTNDPEWSEYNGEEPMLEVTVTVNCYGRKEMLTKVFSESAWMEAKKDGFFMV